MPAPSLRAPKVFEAGFAQIRAELDVPTDFPTPVLEAAQAAQIDLEDGTRRDARDIGFLAIDPPGATDLDQTFAAERRGDGYRVFYAIADVAPFVIPGGPIDLEARERGATLYSPDLRTPLHPPVISEDRASLLAGTDKPALLWTIDLDGEANPVEWSMERAVVQTRAAISYGQAQASIDGERSGIDPALTSSLELLAEIGPLRQAREADRGGVSINLPAQEIVGNGDSYALHFDMSRPVEGWNAQISLLTGIVAARTMVDAGVGILRTLPRPFDNAVQKLRLTAQALDLDWPSELSYADFIRSLKPNTPATNTFLIQSTRTLRGAGYIGFDGELPKHHEHGAISSVYSHVTAPLRRLVDRFGNEILLALFADQNPPAWAIEALDELPSLMGKTSQRTSALERAMVDFAEAMILEHRLDETFEGHVTDLDSKRQRAKIQISDPAIAAHVDGNGRELAEKVRLRLTEANPATRSVAFTVI